jgi:hypothetical protein
VYVCIHLVGERFGFGAPGAGCRCFIAGGARNSEQALEEAQALVIHPH